MAHKEQHTSTHQQYYEQLIELKGEILARAAENDAISKRNMKAKYNKSSKRATIKEGDYILERNERRVDSLNPRSTIQSQICVGLYVEVF